MRTAAAVTLSSVLVCLSVISSVAGVIPQWTPLPVTGEVGDAKCNVEEVESANEHQLHEILNELTNTTYFRLFQVDLSRKCKFWNKNKPQVRAPPPPGCRPREKEGDAQPPLLLPPSSSSCCS